jgi:hypothetical protein
MRGVNMIRAVTWIANRLGGDLVFLASGKHPAPLRRDGHIWLDYRGFFWMRQDLQFLAFPYEWKTLPRF